MWLNESGGAGQDILVGDAGYPGIIVRDAEIQSRVVASRDSANGIYNVGQSYQVWVMPSGLAGNWADGNVESFLMTPWSRTAMNVSGQESWDAAATYVNNFYRSMYRCDNASALVENWNSVA